MFYAQGANGCLPQLFARIAPGSRAPRCGECRHTDGAIAILACATVETASCPVCGFSSCRVHSRYERALRDLPWQGARVRSDLRTRRFYCRSPDCRRKIFTERFSKLTVAYGRQTNRHRELLELIGYALGGEAVPVQREVER